MFCFPMKAIALYLIKLSYRLRGKNCSPAREAVGELSATIWFAKPTSFIYYIGFNKFDVLKTF